MGVWDRRDTWGTEIWGSLWTHNGSHVCACPPPPLLSPTPEAFGEGPGILFISFQLQNPFLALRNSPEFFICLFNFYYCYFLFLFPSGNGGGVEGSESTPPLSPLLMPDSSCQHLEVTQQMVTAVTPTLINYIIIIIDLETGGV